MRKVTELPNHYGTIEDLTLYRWHKYTQTKDNNWFLVDYDGRQSKIENEQLKELENRLIDEYFKAVDDRYFSLKMQKWSKIDWLASKFNTCVFLLDQLSFTINLEIENNTKENIKYLSERRYKIIVELKKWGLKFPELNSFQEDVVLIDSFRTVLDGIKTQIALLNNELVDDGKKENHSLLKQLRIVEIALGYSYRLDAKKITVSEWIEELKLMEEKSKQN